MSEIVQGFAPAAGFSLRRHRSAPEVIDTSLERLSMQGFSTFRNMIGLNTAVERVVVGPSGMFLVFFDKQRSFPANAGALSDGKGRLGRKIVLARNEAVGIARSLRLPAAVPVAAFVCLPGERGTSPNLLVNGVRLIVSADLSAFISAYPPVLSPSQVVELSALAWIRLRRR